MKTIRTLLPRRTSSGCPWRSVERARGPSGRRVQRVEHGLPRAKQRPDVLLGQSGHARDRNHPSVVLWSIGNEIPDVADTATAQKRINWVRAEDATRPSTQNMSSINTNTAAIEDLLGFSYGAGSYDGYHSMYPTWKLIASESSSAVRSRGVHHLPATMNILTASDNQCSSYDNSVVGWGSAAETSWNAINTEAYAYLQDRDIERRSDVDERRRSDGDGAGRQGHLAATARCVRVTVTGLPSGAWASFYELRLFSNALALGSASVDVQTSY